MTDDVSKLPAWPKKPCTNEGVTFRARRKYLERNADAYRARMEALVEVLRGLRQHAHKRACEQYLYGGECTCGLDALLAACERGKS